MLRDGQMEFEMSTFVSLMCKASGADNRTECLYQHLWQKKEKKNVEWKWNRKNAQGMQLMRGSFMIPLLIAVNPVIAIYFWISKQLTGSFSL